MLSDTSVTGGNMAAVLAGLGQPEQRMSTRRVISCIAMAAYLVGMLLAVRLVSTESLACRSNFEVVDTSKRGPTRAIISPIVTCIRVSSQHRIQAQLACAQRKL